MTGSPPLRKIAFDARTLAEPPGGLRRHLEELLGALVAAAPEVDWVGFASAPLPPRPGLRFRVVRAPRTTLLRPLWDRFALPRLLDEEAPDLFFAPAGIVPPRSPVPVVAVVHDLTVLSRPSLVSWRHRSYWSAAARRLPRADRLVAVSEATARAARALLPVDPLRLSVIPSAASALFRPAAAGESAATRRAFGLGERPFVLAVGSFSPRKNLETVAGATAGRDGGAAIPFVVTGRGPAAVRRRWPHVHLLGGLPDDDVARLVAAATVVAVPSLDEGFGLPLLEAMAAGVPVVAAEAGALPEVAGGAAVLLPPGDDDAWRAALAGLLGEPHRREELVARGLARAAAFSWDSTARRLLGVFTDARLGGRAD